MGEHDRSSLSGTYIFITIIGISDSTNSEKKDGNEFMVITETTLQYGLLNHDSNNENIA